MIVGSAFDTTVEDRIATNSPSSSPDSASMICRWDIGAAASGAAARTSGEAAIAMNSSYNCSEKSGGDLLARRAAKAHAERGEEPGELPAGHAEALRPGVRPGRTVVRNTGRRATPRSVGCPKQIYV